MHGDELGFKSGFKGVQYFHMSDVWWEQVPWFSSKVEEWAIAFCFAVELTFGTVSVRVSSQEWIDLDDVKYQSCRIKWPFVFLLYLYNCGSFHNQI